MDVAFVLKKTQVSPERPRGEAANMVAGDRTSRQGSGRVGCGIGATSC